jgi:hypothetical protein
MGGLYKDLDRRKATISRLHLSNSTLSKVTINTLKMAMGTRDTTMGTRKITMGMGVIKI